MHSIEMLAVDQGFLRLLSSSDLHQGYVDGLNDPEVNRYLEVRHHWQTQESVARFIASNTQSTDSLLFGIFICDNPRHVGTVRLHDINKTPGHCYIGICIFDKTVWGSGIATSAIRSVTRWAHLELAIQRIEAHAYLDNVGSIRAFQNAGYRRAADSFKTVLGVVDPMQHAVLVSHPNASL